MGGSIIKAKGILIFEGGIWDTHLFDRGVVLLKSGTPTFLTTFKIDGVVTERTFLNEAGKPPGTSK